jgi:methylmalonyl-CoA mutase C-terminal domain/subunit
MNDERIKVIISKVGLDGHDRGAKVVASLLKEAGMEVVYLGMYQTPEGIIRAAMDEDADVIGVSYLSGEHLVYTPKIVERMRENGLDDVLLVAGGSFPPEDISAMKEMGIDEVFRGGSLTGSIVNYIQENVRRKSG